jgi:hypothetical protein
MNSENITDMNVINVVIKRVEQFGYLGGAVKADGGALQDVQGRIKKANGIFVEIYWLWKNNVIDCC